jgi:septal ring factor EnvC (AmiA/AmiB activator)
MAAKKLKQLNTSRNQHNTSTKRLSHALKTITSKLKNENATIVKADKGKTSVIIYTEDYNKKSVWLSRKQQLSIYIQLD